MNIIGKLKTIIMNNMSKNERKTLLLELVELGLKNVRNTSTAEDKKRLELILKKLDLSLGEALKEVEEIFLKI